MHQEKFSVGIDIGGTNTSVGIVNNKGNILTQDTLLTRNYKTPSELIEKVYQDLLPKINRVGKQNFTGVGIGAPNANYYTGNIELAANLPWKGTIPLKTITEDIFKLPVAVTNDANAAAIGEMIYGAAKGIENFLLITLGTGLGSGFVANGKLIYGDDGFAGELGHVIAIRDGRPCGCGRHGCLETYVSATGIVTTAIEFLQQKEKKIEKQYPESWLISEWRRSKDITSKEIYTAALNHDPLAIEVFEYTGMVLGRTLADVVAITSPKVIILFGGLARARDFILKPAKKSMEDNLLPVYKNKIDIILSALLDRDAAILGAAALTCQ